MNITPAFIFAIAPAAKPEYVADLVRDQSLLTKYGISSVADVCHFLAQCAAETQGFTRLEESLYYTTTARLRAVWPSRFKTDADAARYVRAPEKLANFVYAGRLGNKNPNDGWLYRGSGCPHLTGRFNYTGLATRAGLDCIDHPDLIRTFPAALEAACDFWRANKLARFVGNVTGLTKAWQGGNGALADRKTYTARALKAAEYIDVVDGRAIPAALLLKHGDKGEAVRALQLALEAHGYELGNVDADFGDATERAVREFQRDNRLVSDGVAGPATMNALRSGAGKAKVTDEPSGLDRFIMWLAGLFGK